MPDPHRNARPTDPRPARGDAGARDEERGRAQQGRGRTVTRRQWLVRAAVLAVGCAAVSVGACSLFASRSNTTRPASNIVKTGYQNPSRYYQVSSQSVESSSPDAGVFAYVTPSRIAIDATRDDCVETFIATACSYLGTEYIWNYACAPGVGVDCAGLVLQCMYSVGMDADYNYTPYDHYNVAGNGDYANEMREDPKLASVGVEDRARGDLICYSGHISIYLGDDTVIEALPPDVHFSSMWDYGAVLGVKRVFV